MVNSTENFETLDGRLSDKWEKAVNFLKYEAIFSDFFNCFCER